MSFGKYLPLPVKMKLKTWRAKARSAVMRRFFKFTPDDLVKALHALGLRDGDTVVAHTSFASFEGFTGRIPDAIQAMQAAVGPNGNLLLPTIPFSGSAYEYVQSRRITDIKKTPSQMGLLSEIFRRLPDVTRSIHPTHPMAVWGKRAAELTADHHKALTPCGKGSPFHRLLEVDGKILLAGVDIRSMTFFHYVEEQLEPVMPFSPFTAAWFDLETRGADGQIYQTRTRLFDPAVSSRRDLGMLIGPLRDAGVWREKTVGPLKLIVFSAAEVMATLRSMAEKGKYCYVSAPP